MPLQEIDPSKILSLVMNFWQLPEQKLNKILFSFCSGNDYIIFEALLKIIKSRNSIKSNAIIPFMPF